MNERFRYTDHTKQLEALPRVDVLMIQVRERSHQWVQEALQSVQQQSYPNLGLIEFDNVDRACTIGQGWNACVEESKADLVFLFGDDDRMSVDVVESMVNHWVHLRETAPNVVHVTGLCTVYDEQSGRAAPMNIRHTGMFVRQYLIDHPFDEALAQGIGAAQMARLDNSQRLLGQPMTVGLLHHHGYVWRQHPWMNSGRPIAVR